MARNDPKHLLTILRTASNEQLIAAAKKVVDVRYSDSEWEDLKEAIGELGCLLKSLGIKCKGIV
jgi:hypothetical protein